MHVEIRFLRDVAEALLPGGEVAPNRFAVEHDLAGRRLDQACNDLERRRFSRTVRSEVAGDFARRRLKGDVVDGQASGELLRDAAHFEHASSFTCDGAGFVILSDTSRAPSLLGIDPNQQHARVRRAPGHVGEQAEQAREQVHTRPGLDHSAWRRERNAAEQEHAEHERDQLRGDARLPPHARDERKSTQSDRLPPDPPSRPAAGDLLQHIADEGRAGTRSLCAGQHPERKPRTGHLHPSFTGIPRQSTVSAFLAALTSRDRAQRRERRPLDLDEKPPLHTQRLGIVEHMGIHD